MIKTITVVLSEDTHTEFKKICANEKTYMRNKLASIIQEYIKNINNTRDILKK